MVRRRGTRQPPAADEAALRKMRQLTARAGATTRDDRAQILALIDEIQTLRSRLLAECVRLDDETKRASVRITALRAYAHGAMAIRSRRR